MSQHIGSKYMVITDTLAGVLHMEVRGTQALLCYYCTDTVVTTSKENTSRAF